MYARYTAFEFDEHDRERVLEFWRDVGGPSAARQPGFVQALITESNETPGRLRTVTVWRTREDFERYYASDEHQPLGTGIKSAGLRITERDGLDVLHLVTPPAAVTRVTRATLRPGGAEAARAYWTGEGGDLIRRAPGCLDARAQIDEERNAFVLTIDWRSTAEAESYLQSDDHRAFATGMETAAAEVVERQFLVPLE